MACGCALRRLADLIAAEAGGGRAEPNRRRPSKREHDVADILALLEEHPELRSGTVVARLQEVRRQLLATGLYSKRRGVEAGCIGGQNASAIS